MNYANIDSSYRVIRGGDFGNDATYLRAAHRAYSTPDNHTYGIGVRCARTSQ